MKGRLSLKTQENIFNKILEIEDNKTCADCSGKAPRWASIDFGVFICMNCAGVHRNIGPHITRVKSTILDTWTEDIMDIMVNTGNKIANNYWEFKNPGTLKKPTINSSPQEIQKFVNDKYIKRIYSPSGFSDPVKEFKESKARAPTQLSKEIRPVEEAQKSRDVKLAPPRVASEVDNRGTQSKPAANNSIAKNVSNQGGDLLNMDQDDDESFDDFKTAQVATSSPQVQLPTSSAQMQPPTSSQQVSGFQSTQGGNQMAPSTAAQIQGNNYYTMNNVHSIAPVKGMNFVGAYSNGMMSPNGFGGAHMNNMTMMSQVNTVAVSNNHNYGYMNYGGYNTYGMNPHAQMPGGMNPMAMNMQQKNHFYPSGNPQPSVDKQILKGDNIMAMYGDKQRMY